MPTSVTAVGVIPVTQVATSYPVVDFPRPAVPAVIAIKQLWENQWLFLPELELVRCVATAGGHDAGSCEIARRYGASVKSPHQDAFAERRPLDFVGWWVKVLLVADQGEELQWIGQISTERREVFSTADTQSGVQHWIAYEPLHILRKTHVHRSHWLVPVGSGFPVPVERRTLGWIPDMNVRDTSNVLVGNRSDVKRDDAYAYGGTELWSRYDYLEYVLKHFVDQASSGGPRWEIAGQSELLKSMVDTIKFSTTQTVADIVRRLIPTQLGIDFVIRPIPASPTPGFEVHVFALSATEQSYGGYTLPRNPSTFSINMAQESHAVRANVVSTLDQQYDRINVVGSRMVVCCTLRADDGSLVPKWSPLLEALYKMPTGAASDSPEQHDEARNITLFDPVYAWFGAPVLWDMNDGRAVGPHIADDGSLVWVSGNPPDYQNIVRRTLTELPLREGFDYSRWPAVDRNLSDVLPNLQRPMAFVWSEEKSRWVEVHRDLAAVNTLNDEWGVALEADPNHRLALNDFDLTVDKSEFNNCDPPDQKERFDHAMLVATIALETDQRLTLRHELTSGTEGKGNEITIVVPDAELWILAAGTVVGIDPATGNLQVTSEPRVLRNDIERMSMVMAGAIARYKLARARAEVTFQGYWPKVGLLGQILDVIEEANDTEYIDAPVTSVELIGGPQPMTVVRAGFAR